MPYNIKFNIMAKLHTLTLDLEHDYTLICIHTTLEDYRLAYYINKSLNLKLFRSFADLDFENNKASFSLYEYDDPTNFVTYHLIANKSMLVEYKTATKNALFYNTLLGETIVSYLVNDHKKVDFFLKISEGLTKHQINTLVEQLNSIKQVITAFTINPEQLKQKEHLIF